MDKNKFVGFWDKQGKTIQEIKEYKDYLYKRYFLDDFGNVGYTSKESEEKTYINRELDDYTLLRINEIVKRDKTVDEVFPHN